MTLATHGEPFVINDGRPRVVVFFMISDASLIAVSSAIEDQLRGPGNRA